MNPIANPRHTTRLRDARLTAGLLAAGLLTAGLLAGSGVLTGCGGTSSSPAATQGAASPTSSAGGPVLPVADNPITNTSTVQALKIDSVLVENNVDSTGKTASDHVEIALTNTGAAELTAFEVFYSFTDPTTNVTENYYAKLPADFTIPAGGPRTAHFDNTGAPDHFPVNEFSLYYTDTNALNVTVTVSATDAAIQTTTVQKDAGGAEAAD